MSKNIGVFEPHLEYYNSPNYTLGLLLVNTFTDIAEPNPSAGEATHSSHIYLLLRW